MRWEHIGRIALATAGAATALNLAATLALTGLHRPSAGAAWDDVSLDAGGRDTGWSDAFATNQRVAQWFALVALVVAVVAAVVVVVDRRRTSSTVLAGVGVSAGLAGMLASILSRPVVQWDQLALFAVTVGTDLRGYWTAAFDGGVRFVLVDSTEFTQSTYRTALLVHLAAPVVAAVGLALLWRSISPGRQSRADSTTSGSAGVPTGPPLAGASGRPGHGTD